MAIHKNATKPADDFLTLQDLLALCLAKWKWFVASVFCCMAIAVFYILITPPTYTRTTSILVKEDGKNKSSFSSELNSFAEMGMFQTNTNVKNEQAFMQSPANILEVVKRLSLDYNYSINGPFYKKVIYGRTLPVEASVAGLADNDVCSFTIDLKGGNKFVLSDFTKNGESLDGTCGGTLAKAVATPLGNVTLRATPYYRNVVDETIYVFRNGMIASMNSCLARLTVGLSDEETTIIGLTYQDVSPQRAEEFLGTLISVYNENWVKDKNQIAVSTSQFINDRLQVIEQELGNVDNNISSYKSANLIPDVQAASNMYMEQANEANSQIMSLNNQLYMARYIRSFVTNDGNHSQLLPANSGINNNTIEGQIGEYNEKLLQRNSLAANSSASNPLVKDYDASLMSMRRAIVSSIDNQINSLNAQIGGFRSSQQQSTSRIASNPTQAKYLLSVERQQKVKESLYLFLLQKREENELSQAFTAYNTRIVTPPSGGLAPTAPVRQKILLVAFIIGLLLPAVVIFIKENTNNKLRGRKDLEKISVPFIGEIPLFGKRKKRWALGHKTENLDAKAIVVKEGSRNIINEAFRVLRSNIDFMSGKDNKQNIFVVTSFNPGSGKSFLTMNIAISFAIKKRRVLVIDGDLRHGSTSAYVDSPDKGLSDYLGGKVDDWKSLIVSDTVHESLDILPIGTVPPNPTELLEESRLATIMQSLRQMYDYIFIDCPPIDIVADTQIIEKQADRTIFVVRSGLLDRSMLSELETIYTDKRFKNLSVLLNGTESSGGRYSYRYGYRHGYHYGYDSYYGSQKQG